MEAPARSQRTDNGGNLPPQNIEAEQRVLGAILLDGGEGGTVANVMEILRPEHLYRLSHRVIFQSMITLFEKNDPIDILTVVDGLKKMSKLDEAGGPEYVARLSDDVSSSRRATTYAKLVRDTALQRSLIQTSNAIAERAFQDSEDVDTLIDDAERAIFEVSSGRYEQKIGTMKEIVKTTFPHLEELYDKKELVTGVPTGFADLDKLTSGFQPGELIIVAGRPSMGKTAFALCVAEYAAITARVPTVIFSLEMSSRALAIRMMCGRAMVNAKQLQSGYMPARRWPDLIRAAGELSESQIFVDDSTESSAFDIRAKCRRLQADQGLGLVIVDYLQLISNRTSGGRYESRQLEISEITRSLKGMAKELDLPVVALSQLSRAVESREGKRPGLADLRESGSIEQDADLVALLYREDYYDRESDKKGEATVIVAKQRNGPTDDVQLRFFQDYTRFTNLDTFHQGSPVPAAEVFEEEEEVGF
jgi:replicative DNA helicase